MLTHPTAELGLAGDLSFDTGRGYFLRFRTAEFMGERIPEILINQIRVKDRIECQTLPILKYNQRISDTVNEVVMRSDKLVTRLLDRIRLQVGVLFACCEAIADLDMLASFADLATTSEYIRPDIGEALVVRSARHPIVEAARMTPNMSQPLAGRFVPNDYFATESHRFQIITGCNMSGKSTYIRATVLLQIMAQIGCFVPATGHATFPIVDRIFSRVSTDDSIETNMSTFSAEMREMAFILR